MGSSVGWRAALSPAMARSLPPRSTLVDPPSIARWWTVWSYNWGLYRSIIRHGMAWYGTVWYDTVWYGTVWYGTVWYGMVWYGMVWYGMVWYGMVGYGTVWYGMTAVAAMQRCGGYAHCANNNDDGICADDSICSAEEAAAISVAGAATTAAAAFLRATSFFCFRSSNDSDMQMRVCCWSWSG